VLTRTPARNTSALWTWWPAPSQPLRQPKPSKPLSRPVYMVQGTQPSLDPTYELVLVPGRPPQLLSCTPSDFVPDVTHALPKKMVSALGWTDANHVPLFEAYLEVTIDTVRATARTKENLCWTGYKLWAEKALKKGPMRVDRLPSALEKQC